MSFLKTRRFKSLALVLTSVAVYCVYPVFAVSAVGNINPILFIGVAHTAALLAVLPLILFNNRRISKRRLKLLMAAARRKRVFWLACRGGLSNSISHMCFLSSFYLLKPSVSTLIYETWPVIGMYMTYHMMKNSYKELILSDFIFSILAFVGFVIVVTEGQGSSVLHVGSIGANEFLGVVLALMAGAFMAYSSAVGVKLNKHFERYENPIAASWLVQIITKFWSGILPVVIAAPFALSGAVTLQGLGLAIGAGVIVIAIGASTYIAGLSISRSTNINTLYYLTPVFSLLVLFVLGMDSLSMSIVLGAALIIVANLLISLRADPSVSYSAALITLILSACYVYYVPGVAMEDYFDAVAVPGSIFAILVAFMLQRVHQRQEDQESMAMEVALKAEKRPAYRGESKVTDVIDTLLAIWRPQKDHHNLRLIESLGEQSSGELRDDLLRFYAKKRNSIDVGEAIVLWITGAVLLILMNVYRVNSMASDIMTVGLSAAIAFLLFSTSGHSNFRGIRLFEELTVWQTDEDHETFRTIVNAKLSVLILCLTIVCVLALLVIKHDGAL